MTVQIDNIEAPPRVANLMAPAMQAKRRATATAALLEVPRADWPAVIAAALNDPEAVAELARELMGADHG
jgi:hypothetical protein